jgi:hypothetical protein
MAYPQQTPDSEYRPTIADLTRPAGAQPRPDGPRILVQVAAALLLAAGGFTAGWFAYSAGDGTSSSPTPRAVLAESPLQDAYRSCPAQGGATVADGGRTLTINGRGSEDPSGLDAEAIVCLLDKLSVPTAVIEQMDHTRALDGRQEADWGKFHASWTYHPDDGLDLIVEWRG